MGFFGKTGAGTLFFSVKDRPNLSMPNHGTWRLAVGGGWRLAVGNWWLVAAGGGCGSW